MNNVDFICQREKRLVSTLWCPCPVVFFHFLFSSQGHFLPALSYSLCNPRIEGSIISTPRMFSQMIKFYSPPDSSLHCMKNTGTVSVENTSFDGTPIKTLKQHLWHFLVMFKHIKRQTWKSLCQISAVAPLLCRVEQYCAKVPSKNIESYLSRIKNSDIRINTNKQKHK